MAASVKHFQHLEKIRGWRQQAFVLSLAERSLPNLTFALEVLEIACPLDLQRLVTAMWHELAGNPDVSLVKPMSILPELLTQLAVCSEYGARPAEDTLQLLVMALDLNQQPGLSLARQAGYLSFQTVLRHIEFTAEEGLDEHAMVRLFERDTLAKNELRFQRDVLSQLKSFESLPPALKILRQMAQNDGVSNIGISLEI